MPEEYAEHVMDMGNEYHCPDCDASDHTTTYTSVVKYSRKDGITGERSPRIEHTGIRSIACNICGRTDTSLSNWKMHPLRIVARVYRSS